MKTAGLNTNSRMYYFRQKFAVILAFIFVATNASAFELQDIQTSGDRQEQTVVLTFDQSPEYEVTELINDAGVLLRFRETSLLGGLASIPVSKDGLISSLLAVEIGDDVEVNVSLGAPSSYTLSRSPQGYVLTLAGLEEDQQGTTNTSPAEVTLDSLTFSRVSGDRVQVDLGISGEAPDPVVFRTVNPPRIALDFFGVVNGSNKAVHKVDIASVNSIAIAEDEERMRMVLNLANPVDYRIDRTDSGLALTVFSNPTKVSASINAEQLSRTTTFALQEGNVEKHNIEKIDFKRSPSGGGQIIVKLSDSELAVDLQEIGGEIVAVFPNTTIPPSLEQRLDVTDFATPVVSIDSFADGSDVRLIISPSGQYKQSSVQTGSTLIVEVAPLTRAEIEAERTDEFGYTGERLSLNFQQISVRAALQVIADFTGLNFVTSDAISGDLSLRLKDVPWDQALDVILQTKGLAMRQKGNVVWVAPADEIANKERQALEAQQQVGELAPLVSEFVQINYAKAEDIAELLKSVKAVDTGFQSSPFSDVSLNQLTTEENTLLSARGSVTVDERTNSLLIQDTSSKLREIRSLIQRLDVPVRQVQIETRIVEANDDFSKNLGARLGFSTVVQDAELLGNINVGDTFSGASVASNSNTRINGTLDNSGALSVDLAAGNIGAQTAASYAFSFARLGSGFLKLLDLELSALQAEGKGRIIANPKILTTDQTQASIEQGQERIIVTGGGLASTGAETQEAILSLTVTPQITPDDKITLDVQITNDSFATGANTINTKRIDTQTLLENGETVVIGGIYSQTETQNVNKVPFLGDIPYLGNLFKRRTSTNNRTELLIFLTPRIIDPALAVQ